jgi:hypothetical protein
MVATLGQAVGRWLNGGSESTPPSRLAGEGRGEGVAPANMRSTFNKGAQPQVSIRGVDS